MLTLSQPLVSFCLMVPPPFSLGLSSRRSSATGQLTGTRELSELHFGNYLSNLYSKFENGKNHLTKIPSYALPPTTMGSGECCPSVGPGRTGSGFVECLAEFTI